MGCGTLRPEGPRYEVERRRRKSRDAYGADGMGRGEGVFPSRCGRGLGMGQCSPLPRKFFDFRFQMVTFGAFWWFFSTIQLPVLHAKTGAFWLPKFAVAIYCCISS